jgi:ubiquinone/menaquinone biosynthesis C-methylase UbiE
MEEFNRKEHWENIYENKQLHEVSWYQPKPETSIAILKELGIHKDSKIIDVGGGDSFLMDNLLTLGFQNLTVLDISAKAIERAKKRLGEAAKKIHWIEADIATVKLQNNYDYWHDRAAFHFLTKKEEIENYKRNVINCLQKDGILTIGTFSTNGPKKCSGIEIKQYSETSLTNSFSTSFKKINCFTIDHETPSKTHQNFLFCSFKKK